MPMQSSSSLQASASMMRRHAHPRSSVSLEQMKAYMTACVRRQGEPLRTLSAGETEEQDRAVWDFEVVLIDDALESANEELLCDAHPRVW